MIAYCPSWRTSPSIWNGSQRRLKPWRKHKTTPSGKGRPERNDLQVKERKRVLVYGENFQLPTYDSRRVLDKAIEDAKIRAKLEKVIELLRQIMEEEPQADSKSDRYGRAYRNRTPLQSSIPIENGDENRLKRVHDALRDYEYSARCRESEAAYAARNPHTKKER